MAVEAARNVVVFPLGRGPGRPGGEPEMAALMEAAKTWAERFEAGESLEGYPAWQHGHAPHMASRAGDCRCTCGASWPHEGIKCRECGGTGLVEVKGCTCGAGGYPWPGHEPYCGTEPCPAGCEFVPPSPAAGS
jgi:hypothetical protein